MRPAWPPQLPSSDAIRSVVVAARAEPPLEPHDGDLVVPADPVEQVDELTRVRRSR